MSIERRAFLDPRNTTIVANDDPGAFDKSHVGKPGTHREQRCCNNKAPSIPGIQSRWYYQNAAGVQVDGYAFWARPENQAFAVAKMGPLNLLPPTWYLDSPTPPGWTLGVDYVPDPDPKNWYCLPCATALEEAWAGVLDAFDATIPFQRAISIIVSYVPVYGTAISFGINATIDLEQGESISESALDSLGNALPGQPASGVAFATVRSVIAGQRPELAAITGLLAAANVPPEQVKVITTCVSIAEQIINGDQLSDIAMNQIYQQLPPGGQKAMDLAKRAARGERIVDIAKSEIGEAAANAMQQAADQVQSYGEEATRSFIAQAGYQAAADALPPDLQKALTAGLVAGLAESEKASTLLAANPPPGVFLTTEQNKPSNDALVVRAKTLYAQGIRWRGNLVQGIRDGLHWTYTFASQDPLTGLPISVTRTDTIDEAWRRGFDIAIALCEGKSLDGPGQQKVRASLNSPVAQHGFDAGQAIQFTRTGESLSTAAHVASISTTNTARNVMAIALGRTYVMTAAQQAANAGYAAKGAQIASGSPQVAALRALNPDPRYTLGFDIGTGIAVGQLINGPGKDAVRATLGPEYGGSGAAQQGFDTALQLQFGITKGGLVLSAHPAVAAGQLVTSGMVGTGTSPDQKAGAMQAAASNPATKAGAASVVAAHTGLSGVWASIKEFFGFGP